MEWSVNVLLLLSFVSSLVLKILVAAMENVDGEAGAAGPSTSAAGAEGGAESSSDFYNTGRVGRRNALPDILSSHATVSTADLPDQLSALTTSDKAGAAGPVASTSSSSGEPTPSTSQIATTSNSWKYPLAYITKHTHAERGIHPTQTTIYTDLYLYNKKHTKSNDKLYIYKYTFISI